MLLHTEYTDIFNSNSQDLFARLKLMYGNAGAGLAVTITCMAVLCFAFDTPEQQSTKTLLFSTLLVSHLLRIVDIVYTQRCFKQQNPNLSSIKWRFSFGILMNSGIWATFSVLMVPSMDSAEITVAAVILSSLAGGTITILAASTLLSVIYMTCLIMPFVIMGLFSTVEYFEYISYLGILFWVVMLISSKQVGKFLTEALLLKQQYAQMLKLMDTEKQEVERINNALSRANDKLDNYAYELESEVDRRTNEIYKLSNIDPLTNLSNRTAFLGMLKQKITPSQSNNIKRFLLFIDLNGFKDVNDGFGHKVGDAVLGEIALRLNGLKSIHLSDVCSVGDSSEHSIICRWGGDEFLILSTFETDSCINTLVNAIQARIQEPIHVASNNIGLGASIGIAKFPDDSSVASDLIQYADISMYHHKSINKGGAVYFSHDLLEKFQYDQIVRDGLKNALQSNEFSLVFQPIMDIKTGQPWAFEALLRWQHRNKIVSPNDFIPIAEKAGHIVKIGAWVLTTACKEAAKWNFQQSVSISVNVSALQLIDPDFLDVVKFALLESKLPANKLHLEITESVMLEKGDVVSTTLKAIADMGIHVSIDDFGTGYSSLNQLQNMSFDIIKIDRSFLQGLNQKDLTIISATKLIADEFNAKTIAEGIETQKELSTLESLGIRYIQGFFFSKPMKPEAIEDWYLHLMKNRI